MKRAKIHEIESFDWPSLRRDIKGYKPKKKKDHWLVFIVVLAVAIAFFKFVFEPIVVDPILPKAEAKEVKTEADYEREICENLDRYMNAAEFREYCQTNYGV